MTGEKPYISPPPEADGNYKYYLVAGIKPVRIKYDEDGHQCLGEALSREDPRKLISSNSVIDIDMKDKDVKEITKNEFIQVQRDILLTCLDIWLDGKDVKKIIKENPHNQQRPEADGNYKYYIVGPNMPVRIQYDESGRAWRGESPDREDPRKFTENSLMIYKVMIGEGVKEITKEAFIQVHTDFLLYVIGGIIQMKIDKVDVKKMPKKEPYICPPPEADGNYKYYIVGSNIPVRIKYDENGHECLGEIADKDNPGHLRVSNHHISVVLKGDDADETTKKEFVQACKDYVEYWKERNEMLERKNLKKKTNQPGGLNA